jgi:hypothetical protein
MFSEYKGNVLLISSKLRSSEITRFSDSFKHYFIFLIELKSYRKTLRNKKNVKKYDYIKPTFGRLNGKDLDYEVLMYLSY